MKTQHLQAERQGKTWLNLALSLVLAVASACGTGGGAPLVAPTMLPDFESAAAAAASASPISVTFNQTYKERIDLNEPIARRSAINTDKSLFKVIKAAQSTLDGAFYDIEDPGVVDALIEAKERGVTVRLVTDNANLVEKHDPSKPRAAIVALKQAGIKIVDDNRSAIMHHKFLVADTSVVWTGSTNLTPTSLYRHNNNAVVLRTVPVAKAFTEEFNRLFVKHQFGISDRGRIAPLPAFQVGGAEVRVFFSPGGSGREAVVAELAAAKKSIQFMTFSLTDPTIGQTMADKATAGVAVSGIFDRWLAGGKYSLFNAFKSEKMIIQKDGNEALMHHKVIIVDGTTVISGSYNYSQNAEMNNNEAFLIVKRAPSFANAFEGEFKKLQQAAKVNRPPPYKPKDAEIGTVENP
ncbi:MAG: hypothetical protein H7338_21795 [Candidatus Sericytochromatia bacterium]|nr:hypothetical protein [Candidatus Sericytochromatia bacterium]